MPKATCFYIQLIGLLVFLQVVTDNFAVIIDLFLITQDGHTAMWTALYNGCATCVGLLVNAGDVRNEVLV